MSDLPEINGIQFGEHLVGMTVNFSNGGRDVPSQTHFPITSVKDNRIFFIDLDGEERCPKWEGLTKGHWGKVAFSYEPEEECITSEEPLLVVAEKVIIETSPEQQLADNLRKAVDDLNSAVEAVNEAGMEFDFSGRVADRCLCLDFIQKTTEY